jgi:hypothetical protein
MSPVSETQHCVNKIAPSSLGEQIRQRLDLPNDQIAALLDTNVDYVRAVRSRQHRKRLGLPPPPSDQRKCRRAWQPTGQPQEELRRLAETLVRWRQEGRYAQ